MKEEFDPEKIPSKSPALLGLSITILKPYYTVSYREKQYRK